LKLKKLGQTDAGNQKHITGIRDWSRKTGVNRPWGPRVVKANELGLKGGLICKRKVAAGSGRGYRYRIHVAAASWQLMNNE